MYAILLSVLFCMLPNFKFFVFLKNGYVYNPFKIAYRSKIFFHVFVPKAIWLVSGRVDEIQISSPTHLNLSSQLQNILFKLP